MSSQKEDATRLIEWTGERCVPWVQDTAMLYEHFHRYLWAPA
jgi:O-antigen biosynthesis protein